MMQLCELYSPCIPRVVHWCFRALHLEHLLPANLQRSNRMASGTSEPSTATAVEKDAFAGTNTSSVALSASGRCVPQDGCTMHENNICAHGGQNVGNQSEKAVGHGAAAHAADATRPTRRQENVFAASPNHLHEVMSVQGSGQAGGQAQTAVGVSSSSSTAPILAKQSALRDVRLQRKSEAARSTRSGRSTSRTASPALAVSADQSVNGVAAGMAKPHDVLSLACSSDVRRFGFRQEAFRHTVSVNKAVVAPVAKRSVLAGANGTTSTAPTSVLPYSHNTRKQRVLVADSQGDGSQGSELSRQHHATAFRSPKRTASGARRQRVVPSTPMQDGDQGGDDGLNDLGRMLEPFNGSWRTQQPRKSGGPPASRGGGGVGRAMVIPNTPDRAVNEQRRRRRSHSQSVGVITGRSVLGALSRHAKSSSDSGAALQLIGANAACELTTQTHTVKRSRTSYLSKFSSSSAIPACPHVPEARAAGAEANASAGTETTPSPDQVSTTIVAQTPDSESNTFSPLGEDFLFNSVLQSGPLRGEEEMGAGKPVDSFLVAGAFGRNSSSRGADQSSRTSQSVRHALLQRARPLVIPETPQKAPRR